MRSSFLPLLSDWMGGVFTLDDWRDEDTISSEEMRLTLPGYETIEVSLQPRTKSLLITGKDKAGKEACKYTYYLTYFNTLDQEAVEAEYRRGILTVKLPKKVEEKKKLEEKSIKVKLLE